MGGAVERGAFLGRRFGVVLRHGPSQRIDGAASGALP